MSKHITTAMRGAINPSQNSTQCMVEEHLMIGSFCFRGALGNLNCDICMCVVLHEFVFNSIYVYLKYNEIYLTFTDGSRQIPFLFIFH